MACCGAQSTPRQLIANEPRAGAVLVCPRWAGLRNYWGTVTGNFYGRVSNALLLWVDEADLADPQLTRVELPNEVADEPAAQTTTEAAAEPVSEKPAARRRGK